VVIAGLLLVAVYAVTAGGDYRAVPPIPEQVRLQSSIVDDRAHLFNGVLTYQPLDPMDVGDNERLVVTLTAVGQRPGAVVLPRGELVGSRDLQVGGVEEATLTVAGAHDRVAVTPVGPSKGLIGRPGDRLHWQWDLVPKEPGTYTLELVVVTFRGTSDTPLATVNPPIDITLHVADTWKHRFTAIRGAIIGLAALLAAIAGILTFFREQIRARLPGRRRSESDGESSGPDPE
jgi:hypothetical protein